MDKPSTAMKQMFIEQHKKMADQMMTPASGMMSDSAPADPPAKKKPKQ